MRSLSISTPSSNIGPILCALFKHRHWLPRALLWVASFKCQLKLSSNISDTYLERISERLKDAVKSQTLLSRVSITLLEYFLSVPSPFFSQPRKNARSFFVALFICSRVTPGVGSKERERLLSVCHSWCELKQLEISDTRLVGYRNRIVYIERVTCMLSIRSVALQISCPIKYYIFL